MATLFPDSNKEEQTKMWSSVSWLAPWDDGIWPIYNWIKVHSLQLNVMTCSKYVQCKESMRSDVSPPCREVVCATTGAMATATTATTATTTATATTPATHPATGQPLSNNPKPINV